MNRSGGVGSPRAASPERGAGPAAHGPGAGATDGPGDGGPDEAPPVPLRWGQLYALVLLVLAASIAALAWLTGRWR